MEKTYDTLSEKYSHLFIKDELYPLPMFGFECGIGWYDILSDLLESIDTYLKSESGKALDSFSVVQIKEKFGCYDTETEILTKEGWKYFKDVTYNDLIATLENGIIKYYNPIDIISYHYKGKMYELNSRGVNLLVTPNHKLYIAKGNYYDGKTSPPIKRKYDFELATPDKYFGKKKRFSKGGIWTGEKIETIKIDDYSYEANIKTNELNYIRNYNRVGKEFNIISFLKFLGFYTAEGCCNEKTGEISVAFCNVDNGIERQILHDLISDLGYDIKESMLNKSAGICKIYDKTLAIWLYNHVGQLSHNKKTPNFVKELTPELIEFYLTYLYMGDGHETPTSNILTTTSKKLSEDVEELLLKAGYSFYTFKVKPKISGNIIGKHVTYNINWLLKSNDFNIETSTPKKSKSFVEKWIEYDDMVYCVTVPNNIVYIKRCGKGVWCGNSLRFYTHGGDRHIDALISKAEDLADRTCEFCGSNENIMRSTGWIVTACKNCTENRDGLKNRVWIAKK